MPRPSLNTWSIVGLLCLGAVSATSRSSAATDSDWSSSIDRRHAHFLFAGGDSLQTWRVLREAGADARPDSTWQAIALRSVTGWAMGDSISDVAGLPSGTGEDLEEDLRALETWYHLEQGDLSGSTPRSPRHRLVWAALALQAKRPDLVIAALPSKLDGDLGPLRWTLLAAAEMQREDRVAAGQWIEKLARLEKPTANVVSRDQAALTLATWAVEAADSSRAQSWLQRIDAGSALAPQALFLRVTTESDPESQSNAWAQFLARFPDHSLRRAAELRLAATQLDRSQWADALEHYRWVLTADSLRHRQLSALMADSGARLASVWSENSFALMEAPDSEVQRLEAGIASQLFADFDSPPKSDPTNLSSWIRPQTSDALAPTAEQLRTEAHLAEALRHSLFEVRLAQSGLDQQRAQTDSRQRQLDRGEWELGVATSEMALADTALAASAAMAESTRTRWLSIRDRAIRHLQQRAQRLELLAQENLDRADRIDLLYLQGPMSRLERRDLATIPLPAELVAGERTLQTAIASESQDFARASQSTIERSVEEVMLPLLYARLDSVSATADSLRSRGDSIGQWLTHSSQQLAVEPTLLAARAHVDAALAVARRRLDQWASYRSEVANEVVANALAQLESAGEGPLYGAAIAALQLGIEDESNQDDLALAEEWMTDFLDRYPHSVAGSDLQYRLADLLLVRARADFQARMGRYLENGAVHPSLMPLWNVDAPIALYESILRTDPHFDRRDRVLFQLGMLHADLADGEAQAPLLQMVHDHPQSPLVAAAQLRLGELAFEDKSWRRATEHLTVAARTDELSTRVVALYKLGWSHYALDEFDVAADAFLDLLDIYAGTDARPELGFDIALESRDLLVRSLARSGGASAFVDAFERRGRRDYEADVLLDLGALVADYALEEPRDEVDQTLLARFPLHPEALAAAQRRSRRVNDPEEAVALVDPFRHGQPWATAQTSDSLRTAGDRFALQIFEARAQSLHRVARSQPSSDSDAWTGAQRGYEQLQRWWPDHELSARWQLLAAECASKRGDWSQAVEFAHAAQAAATDSLVLANTAAWQAVAYQDAWYRRSKPDSNSVGADSLATGLVNEIDRYCDAMPTDPRGADLQWRAAQLSWAHGWAQQATDRFLSFAEGHPADPRARQALRSRAEIYYREDDFDAAALAFADAGRLEREQQRPQSADELDGWVVHCEFRGVEAAAADSTLPPTVVAARWERVATRWPEAENADRAWYNAGVAWTSPERSRDAFGHVWNDYPESELRLDAGRNLARSFEESGESARAAEVLREFARAAPEAEDAATGLLHAVDLYEQIPDEASRNLTLDEYLALYPEDQATQAFVLAERANAELDALAKDDGLETSVQSFLTGTSTSLAKLLTLGRTQPDLVPRRLRARVDFLRAQEQREVYTSLQLTQPLEAAIARKQAALTDLLVAYQQVTESSVAPWSQAAAFRSGEALVAFGDALRESERPADLQGDDLLAYEDVLEEQAWNFFDRGEATWKQLILADAPVEADSWMETARKAFYLRTSQRYLHMPSFDFPLVRAEPPSSGPTAKAR